MITYEQRRERIQCEADIAIEIERARRYLRKKRRLATKAEGMGDKQTCLLEVRQAESVLRQLRLNIFNIEDAIQGKRDIRE